MSFLIFLFSYQAVGEIAVSAGVKPAPLLSLCALLRCSARRGDVSRGRLETGEILSSALKLGTEQLQIPEAGSCVSGLSQSPHIKGKRDLSPSAKHK